MGVAVAVGLVFGVGARVGVSAAVVVGLGLDAVVAVAWAGAVVAFAAVVGLAGSDGPGALSEHAASVTAAAASAAVNMAAVWRMFIGIGDYAGSRDPLRSLRSRTYPVCLRRTLTLDDRDWTPDVCLAGTYRVSTT